MCIYIYIKTKPSNIKKRKNKKYSNIKYFLKKNVYYMSVIDIILKDDK